MLILILTDKGVFTLRDWHRGHPSSVDVIMKGLEEFKNVSGLVLSIPKSTAFFCNVPNALKTTIINSMPFAEGSLPVRYLGVPLISSRLLYRDCKILVEKLESCINDWRNKFLSIAGRLQLIRLVFSSMHIYWASVFILPARIIHDLEQLMRRFIWCQGELKKGKAKVAWDSVCKPKLEGGLGIQRLDDFNIALMATHIWSIITHKESLWVKWIHSYKLKGRSFWDVPCLGDVSWGWRKLLQIRPLIRPFIWNMINNGKLTSMWFDKGHDLCPIRDMLTIIDITPSGFGLADSDSVRLRADVVDWYHLVWFPQCIPMHAFHLWLVAKQKLKMQDRLRQWDVGPSIDLNLLKCPLCDIVPDTHAHLFFECPFSMQVWSQGTSVVSIISQLLLGVVSYYIWSERNSRLFKKKASTVPQIVQVITSMVHLKPVIFKFKKVSTQSRLLLDQWKIPSCCLVHEGSSG
ncbi:putative reverse transcriptase domain, reverse transcriptase zinc-binding domain protein [Tanacetum coccineum]